MMLLRYSLPLLAAVTLPLGLRAQTATRPKEPLKQRPVVVRMRTACSAPVVQSASPTEAQRRDARDMAQRARQSAIFGDAAAQLSQLRSAAALDPTDPNLAYELARAYEHAGVLSSAALEYCRFLSLAPSASEAPDVRAHVATLVRPEPDTVVTVEGTAFERGVGAYDKGQWADAEEFFTTVIRVDSMSAEAYYNRALVRALQQHHGAAADDYERYLQLRRDALDRELVVTRVNQLRAQRLSASQAFGLGMVIPGGGQFYTRRPVRGFLSLAGVGAAAAFALTETKTSTTTTRTAVDPFGNQYSYSVTTPNKSRPYVVAGLGVAGGIALFSAIDAALYARSVRASSVSVSLVTSGNGVGAVGSVRIP
jgi:tetratricopeptide (TPR) repeat protein